MYIKMDVETINTIEVLRLGRQEFCGIFNDYRRFKVEDDGLFPTGIRIDGNFTVLKRKYVGMGSSALESMKTILKT